MQKVLYILFLYTATGCGSDGKFFVGELEHYSIDVEFSIRNECGGNIPCKCGNILISDRTFDSQDKMRNCYWNTKIPALTIKNGAKLNCSRGTISVEPDINGNFNNIRTGILISHNSNGSAVYNCTIYGFHRSIYVEMVSRLIKNNGISSFKIEAPEKLSFINNKFIIGGNNCIGLSCGESYGIWIQGWPGATDSPKDVLIWGNYFGMARSHITDKESFLYYGSYIRTTSLKNLQIWFNYFDEINYGYAIRLLYDVRANIIANTFIMHWERFISKKYGYVLWTPSGIGIEVYNGKYGYPEFDAIKFNAFYINEDKFWPPEPFGNPPTTGVNHEYVAIRSGWGSFVTPVDATHNWWKRLSDNSDYSDLDIARLVYGRYFTVSGIKYEDDYREIKYLPRLK